MGPVETEMVRRLQDGLSPTRLIVRNDSDNHLGHAGHDGSGESHFSILIEAAQFTGKNRVERQRIVNRALGELTSRVHALSIRAIAPGEGD